MPRSFSQLDEREILALAMTLEEEDARIYGDIVEGLETDFPATASVFTAMQAEEIGHRRRLAEQYRGRFGEHVPLIRRQDVKGFVQHKPVWLVRPLGIEAVRGLATTMEVETRRFYERAAAKVSNVSTRELLLDLAAEERMGTVTCLARNSATHNTADAFRVGVAASVGAGISMGFAEALSDDGSLTGRGRPVLRGFVCGLMTFAGGIGHTLPYLIPDFRVATTVAAGIVIAELVAISAVRNRYMDTPFLAAAFQVIVGGLLVFFAGILIGSS